jgi:hypothetical protein
MFQKPLNRKDAKNAKKIKKQKKALFNVLKKHYRVLAFFCVLGVLSDQRERAVQ